MFALAKKAMPEATPTSVFSELSNNQKSIPELDLSAGPGGATCANCGDAGTCFECNTASRNPSCHSLAQCLATAQLPMEAFRRQTADLTSAIVNKGKSLRGVPESELAGRLERAQALMEESQLDSILLTTEQDFFYFTGMPSRFWNSPTRPFFLLVPREGERPIAVVPSIMKHCIVSRTWMREEHVQCWAAPQPEDDGVTLLARTIATGLPQKFGRVGFQMGLETTVRMPLADVDRVRALLKESYRVVTVDGREVMRSLRLVKSPLEVARVKHTCAIASAAFSLLPHRLHALRATKLVLEGLTEVSEREARDALRMMMVEFGADDTAYVMAQSGQGGYDNIVLEPSDDPLKPGAVLIIDTGITFEGYWCDFDRNYIVGGLHHLPAKTAACHDMLWRATEKGFEEAGRKGATSTSVFRAMARECDIPDDAADDAGVGRFGHGLGLQLTELFSNNATDETPLAPGFVMTLEPSALIDPAAGDELMIAHEEDIAITEHGAVWLSLRAPRQMDVILGDEAHDLEHADPLAELSIRCAELKRALEL
jgi:Xaa-Pro dipeptidase